MSKFSNLKLRYKIGVGVATGAAVLAGGGVALAYFTSSGNGTGSANVGTSSNWSVAQTGHSGTLYPCGSSFPQTGCGTNQETLTFTVTNNSTGAQLLTYNNLKTAIDSALGTESPTHLSDVVTGGSNSQSNTAAYPNSNLSGGTAVNNCQASWFNSTITSLNGAQSDVDVAGSGTATVVVTVGMKDSGSPQDACQSQTPDVDLWVS